MNIPISQHSTPDDNDEIDLLALFGTLLDYRWLIILVTLAFSFLGIAYALLATPIYQANALIQIEERKGGIAGLDGMEDLFSAKSQAGTEIEILKSRMVIGQAVDDLNLLVTAKPRTFPVIGQAITRHFQATKENTLAKPWFGLSQFDWGGAKIDVFQFELSGYLQGKPLQLIAKSDQTYSLYFEGEKLLHGQVGELVETDNIKLLIQTLHANPGTEFTLAHSNRLRTIKTYQGLLQASEKGKQSGILNLSLNHANALFAKQMLDKIANIYLHQNIARLSAEASNSLDFLRKQLPNVRKDMEQAEEKMNSYQISAKSADISLETQSILNQLVKLETELSTLKLKRLEIDKLYTSEHPSYQTLMSQINSLETDKTQFEKRVSTLPEVQQELLRLKRDVGVSAQIYIQLLQKAQELDIARASTVGNVRIIDHAAVDTGRPIAPKKHLIVVIATLLGLLLSLAIAVVHSLFSRGVESPDEIEALDLAVFASIPFSAQQTNVRDAKVKNGHERFLLSLSHPTDLTVESLRSLHTSLHFTVPESINNIVMISGPSPAVGKSFIAANLAVVMAQSGKKTLLIDGDMRKGHLHRYFGHKNQAGLSSLLSAQSTIEESVQRQVVDNLDFVSRGPSPPNPSELLLAQRFSDLMQDFVAQYDIVIIDTPPVLAVADALIVGKIAGSSLMAVRFGLNPTAEIRSALKRFEDNGVTIKGAILNAVIKTAGSRYKYGHYAYQYDYQSDNG